MFERDNVDPRDRGDPFDILEARDGLDLRDQQGLFAGAGDLLLDVARDVIIVRHPEGGASASHGRVLGRAGDQLCLLGAFDHPHHDTHRAKVEHLRDQVVLDGGDTDERDDSAARDVVSMHAHDVRGSPRVLLVEEHEVGPGRGRDTGEA